VRLDTRSNRPLVNRALVKNTREKSTLLGNIDSDATDMNYCVYMATSGKLIQCTLALVLLTMVEVLSGGVSTLGTQMRSGGRKDVPTLNTRDTSLNYITMHSALLVG